MEKDAVCSIALQTAGTVYTAYTADIAYTAHTSALFEQLWSKRALTPFYNMAVLLSELMGKMLYR